MHTGHMWKVKSVQVCNERGAIGSSLGTISRLSAADGWEFELGDQFVLAVKGESRLRLPASLVVVEESLEADPAAKPKRSKEAA
jgi:hypothetical protein